MPPTINSSAGSLGDQYDKLFDLIRKEFPYGDAAELTVPDAEDVEKGGWLKDHNITNPRYVLEEEVGTAGDDASFHWEFNGMKFNGKDPRITKALRIVYRYQRPVPKKGPDGKPKVDPATGNWVLETHETSGVPKLETVEASLFIGYGGPSH